MNVSITEIVQLISRKRRKWYNKRSLITEFQEITVIHAILSFITSVSSASISKNKHLP